MASSTPAAINLLLINDPAGRPHIAMDPAPVLARLSELPPNVKVITATDSEVAAKAVDADAIMLWKGSKAGLQKAFTAAGPRLRWVHVCMAGKLSFPFSSSSFPHLPVCIRAY